MPAFSLVRVFEPAPTRNRAKTVAPVRDGCEKQKEFVQRRHRGAASLCATEKQGSAIKLLSAHVHCIRSKCLCGASSTRHQIHAAVAAKRHGLILRGRGAGTDGEGSDSGISVASNAVPNALLSHVPNGGSGSAFIPAQHCRARPGQGFSAQGPTRSSPACLSCARTCSEACLRRITN
jgi:hypothetical protein